MPTTSPTDIHVIEWSSKWSESPASLLGYLQEIARDQKPDAILITEMTGDPKRASLLENVEGYDYFHIPKYGKRECAILWRADWQVKAGYAEDVSGGETFRIGKKMRAFNHCATVVIDHPMGLRMLLSVDHMPSSVQGAKGLKGRLDKVRTYRAVQKEWKAHIKDMTKRWNPDIVVAGGDFNLNWLLQWVRTYMSHWRTAGLKAAWTPKTLPEKGGTIKKARRIIDGLLVGTRNRYRYKVQRAYILPETKKSRAASDHRAVGVMLRVWKKARRKKK